MSKTIVGSLCWVFERDRVLMIKRRKYPYQGYWAALGGKIEAGESPCECAIREVREESGLIIERPDLRGAVSVQDKATSHHWMLFVYMANNPQGTLEKTTEGDVAWIPMPTPANLPIAKTDQVYLDEAVKSDSGIFLANIVYDESALFDVVVTRVPNTQAMKQIVAQHGWPGEKLVGAMGAQAAWLLVQHVDHDREFQ